MHSWADKARGLCSYVCALWVAGVEVPHGARGERLLEILEAGRTRGSVFLLMKGYWDGWVDREGALQMPLRGRTPYLLAERGLHPGGS